MKNLKNNFILLLIGLILANCTSLNLQPIQEYQSKLANEWLDPETTTLKEDEKADFPGILFYPISKKYIVSAQFSPISDGNVLPFPTSAKKTKYYKEYGKLNFKLENRNFELTLYQSSPLIEGYENSLFLPFTDETNGDTSYGGGRYLDFEISDIKSNYVELDFNKAYNPYCAYSKYYNCPIPPAQNRLDIEIKAGVRY